MDIEIEWLCGQRVLCGWWEGLSVVRLVLIIWEIKVMSGFKRRVVERKGVKKQREFEDKLIEDNLEDFAHDEGELEEFLEED